MKTTFSTPIDGVGFGLHRSMLEKLFQLTKDEINFFEIAPENWINVGGKLGKKLRAYTERFPFVCHGLSLSLGSPAPLNIDLLKSIKHFLHQHNIDFYSEHLSYSSDFGNLYELLPMPFTEDAVNYLSERINQAQDMLGRRIAIENATYYDLPEQEMTEHEFINAVLEKSDCSLLLDINNLFVNSNNHNYDAIEFLRHMQGEKIAYIHIAGHDAEKEDFLIDNHGSPVTSQVWDLLEESYSLFNIKPTLLERDNNIPPVAEILKEIDLIKKYQQSIYQNL